MDAIEQTQTDRSHLVFGNRIPYESFTTKGAGESDIAIHAGSYHLVHGSVMETIMAVGHFEKDLSGTAGIIYGWLYDKKSQEKFGGLVCEHAGLMTETEIGEQLKASLQELYTNGFSDQYDLKETELIVQQYRTQQKHGTALVVLGFTPDMYPLIRGQ